MGSMIRATTPTHYFRFPVDPEARFDVIEVTYRQDEENVLVKEKADMSFSNAGTADEPVYIGQYTLTQQETKLFRGCMPGETQGNADVYIQVRALTTDGDALASKVYRVSVQDVLNDGVLTDGT